MPSPGLTPRGHRFHVNPLLEKHRMRDGVFEQKVGGLDAHVGHARVLRY